MIRLLKYIFLKALRGDATFAVELQSYLLSMQMTELNNKNAYILVISSDLDEAQIATLKSNIPKGTNFTVIAGMQARLIELVGLTETQ